MGNSESSSLPTCLRAPFSPEEWTVLDNVFDILAGSTTTEATKSGKAVKKQVTMSMLKAYVHGAVLGTMTVRLYNAMRSMESVKSSTGFTDAISKKQFVLFLSYVMRGTAEERSLIIQKMISQDPDGPVKGKQVKEFTEELIRSVIQLMRFEKMLKGWSLEKTANDIFGTARLTVYLMSELKAKDEQLATDDLLNVEYEHHALKDWMYRVSLLPTFLHLFVALSLHITNSQSPGELFTTNNVLPECVGLKYTGLYTILDIPSIMYLNLNLPSESQHQWKLLFSSQAHGESFSRLFGQILHQGPSLLVIKDFDGYIFGGFASHSWAVKPQFQGDRKCFLFTLSPQLGVYTCTGYNDHYMYLNHGQQTMPNGLGMGGQHNYFGLWIDSDYGGGHSKAKPRCTTYNSPQLSAQEYFKINILEVWTVGTPPEDLLPKTKSVLDGDPEAQALLEMIGKSKTSTGLRDPGEED
uniref:MTOR-associated protein MEAK7 n=1 Tax=Pristiophorus japonicus TaxID=55135 RepID=UPI00398E5AFD